MVASCNLQHAAVCFEAGHQCICCHLCSDGSGFSFEKSMPLITCVEAPMLRLLLFANHPSIIPRSLLVGADKRVYFCLSDVYSILYTHSVHRSQTSGKKIHPCIFLCDPGFEVVKSCCFSTMPFFCHGCDNLRASTGVESQSFPVSPVSENCLGPSNFLAYLEAIIA